MRTYRIKISILLTFSGIVSIFVFALVLIFLGKASADQLEEILLHYGLIVLPISFFWWLLENYAWHWKIIQKVRPLLNIPPDFRGRWVGSFKRDNEEHVHELVIEIKQKLSKITVNTYSKLSTSNSISADILVNETEDQFTVCYCWIGNGGNDIPSVKTNQSTFDGNSLLILYPKESPKRLSGKYFTNREPQTKGHITLHWHSYEYLDKF